MNADPHSAMVSRLIVQLARQRVAVRESVSIVMIIFLPWSRTAWRLLKPEGYGPCYTGTCSTYHTMYGVFYAPPSCVPRARPRLASPDTESVSPEAHEPIWKTPRKRIERMLGQPSSKSMALHSAIMVKVPSSSAMESGWHDGDGHKMPRIKVNAT